MTDIRKKTCILIKKNGDYLVGKILWSNDLRWSKNRYDAWQTREKKDAEDVARKTGGIMVLFNPVVGQEKIIGG